VPIADEKLHSGSYAHGSTVRREGYARQIAAFLLLLLISRVAQPAQLEQQTVDEWNRYILATQAQIDKRVSGQPRFCDWIACRQQPSAQR
jgi:hypothetical protein